jgi:VWFA-related protein
MSVMAIYHQFGNLGTDVEIWGQTGRFPVPASGQRRDEEPRSDGTFPFRNRTRENVPSVPDFRPELFSERALFLSRSLPIVDILALLLLLCSGWVPASSQVPPENASSALDVVVLDKRGNRLTDLDKEDLRVTEDGAAQSIQAVRKGNTRNGQSTLITPPSKVEGSNDELYTNIAASSAAGQHQQILLLVDLLNSPRSERFMVLDRLATLLQAPLAEHLTIYGLSGDLSLLQDYSGTPQTLFAAMNLVKTHAGESATFLSGDTGATLPAPPSLREGPLEFLESVKAFAAFSQEPPLSDRRSITLTALRTIARALQGMPGRKSLIWFSNDFSCTTATVFGSGIYGCSGEQPDSRAVFQRLQEARISIYAVNASKMRDRSEDHRSVLTLERSPRGTPGITATAPPTFAGDLTSRDMAMQQLADVTGGRNLKNKSLAGSVQIARDDNDQFLEIRFGSPTNSDVGAHAISATSTRHSTTTLYRHIYFGKQLRQPTESPESIHEEILSALTDRLQSTGVILAARKQVDKSGVDLFIDPRTLSLETRRDGKFELDVDVATATLSPSYRILTGNTDRISKVLTADELQSARQTGLMLRLGYAPHQHAQWVRALVRDARSGRLGSIDIPLQCCNVLR